jgi:hypothetical protein
LNAATYVTAGTSIGQQTYRTQVLIQIACSLYNLHPSVSARYWFFWVGSVVRDGHGASDVPQYHAFNSAVTLGTFIMTDPSNELAPLAISQMDQVINVYTMLVQSRASHRMTDNLRWLLRLRKRSFETLSRGPTQRVEAGDAAPLAAEDDRELLGWRTRLIQRMGKGVQKATTIVPPVNSTPSPYSAMTQTMTEVLQQQLGSNPIQQLQTTMPVDTSSEQLYEATDELVSRVCDEACGLIVFCLAAKLLGPRGDVDCSQRRFDEQSCKSISWLRRRGND